MLALAATLVAASASAQMEVRPIPVELDPGLSSSTVIVRNTGVRPLAVQARVFDWQQVEGEDLLAPTEAIALSPAITEIAPGAEQVIRVLRLGPAPVGQDSNYRLVVDEIPAGNDPLRAGTISIRLQMILPLFVRASSAPGPLLDCTLPDTRTLVCQNLGGQAARLTSAQLSNTQNGESATVKSGLLGYVLPGSSRSWPLPASLDNTDNWRLDLKINDIAMQIGLGNAQ